MRQESSQSIPQSNSGFSTQTNEARKQRMDKKRAIRKNKIGFIQQDFVQQKGDKRFLTKQQKLLIQKAKNRQAAQRSRDQHKKYVQDLQEENRLLKAQLAKPKYCIKCSKLVSTDSQDSTDHNLLDLQNEGPIETFVKNQNNQESQQNDPYFIRMHDYQESSPLKMFLFISMIMLGIFLIGAGEGQVSSQNSIIQRNLIQIKNQINDPLIQNTFQQSPKNIDKQIIQIQKYDLMNSIQNNFNMDNEAQNDKSIAQVIPLSYQLSPLSQENCLRSIIDQNYTVQKISYPLPQQQIQIARRPTSLLRERNSFEMEIFSKSNVQSKDNILFCSLPKLYRKVSQNSSPSFFSKFIDVILSGSQMMQIIGKSPNLWMNKMVSFNGIYKINAQIKQIVQIQDKNCIL